MIKLVPNVLAADQTVDIGKNVTGFFGYTCLGNLVNNVIDVVFILGAVATFIFLVVGGVEWLTSGGDKTKIETARKMISNAIIGLAIVAASWAIYSLVITFFGIDVSKLCTENPI